MIGVEIAGDLVDQRFGESGLTGRIEADVASKPAVGDAGIAHPHDFLELRVQLPGAPQAAIKLVECVAGARQCGGEARVHVAHRLVLPLPASCSPQAWPITQLSARTPNSATGQIEREAIWLPVLAPYLPVALPEPVAVGEPGHGYPYPWAVHRWVPGEGATLERMADPQRVAGQLANVVRSSRHKLTELGVAVR